MDVTLKIESPLESDLKAVLAELQDKFPHVQFERKKAFVLYRKDDLRPQEQKPLYCYSAKAYITWLADQ